MKPSGLTSAVGIPVSSLNQILPDRKYISDDCFKKFLDLFFSGVRNDSGTRYCGEGQVKTHVYSTCPE